MGVLDSAKGALEIAKKINNLDLQRQLIEVQEKILELQEENASLKQKIRILEDAKELTESLISEKNAYWKETKGQKDGPFCTACQDSKKQLVRLHLNDDRSGATCPVCRTYIELIQHRPSNWSALRPHGHGGY